MWYCYALLGPAIWALLNHLDKYLLERFFKSNPAGPVLVVFIGFAGFMVAIAIAMFASSVFALTPWQAFCAMSAGALLIASYIPYMIAMQRDEATLVASLYRLTPVFVFVLSYIVLDEGLRPRQMVGGAVTIVGSISLIADLNEAGHDINFRAFFLMCATCLMNACSIVIFKFAALESSFWSSAFWMYVGTGLFSLILVCSVGSFRRAMRALLRSRDAYVVIPVTLAGAALNFLANLAVGFAGLMAKLSLVSIVTGLHPVFLFVYGTLFTIFIPAFGSEDLTRRHITRKIAAIGILGVGMGITFL